MRKYEINFSHCENDFSLGLNYNDEANWLTIVGSVTKGFPCDNEDYLKLYIAQIELLLAKDSKGNYSIYSSNPNYIIPTIFGIYGDLEELYNEYEKSFYFHPNKADLFTMEKLNSLIKSKEFYLDEEDGINLTYYIKN